jgi:hypothetical protein
LLLVDVSVGAVPAGHLTALPQEIVLAVPSAVKASVNPNAVPDDGTFVKVSVVILAFKLTANTLPAEQSSVSVPLEILGVVLVSLSPVSVLAVSV